MGILLPHVKAARVGRGSMQTLSFLAEAVAVTDQYGRSRPVTRAPDSFLA